MRLFTPPSLLYPITVTRLRCQPGDKIEEQAPLFSYTYISKVDQGNRDDKEGKLVEQTWPADFTSELEGTVTSLSVTVGQVIERRTLVADIEEECKHDVQFGGMCANCGKDMKEVRYNTTIRGTDRANVNTSHANTGLLVSRDEASRTDEEARRRLLDSRKLTLVVDLDQTVIQAVFDTVVGRWMNDPDNPNFEALQEVRVFYLEPHTYYIKLRPGLAKFLQDMAEIYEMHIYTAATRDYALNITKFIDPDRKFFGDRILSRDESGNLHAKSLQRLFPVNTKMVLIIDDRGDTWHWIPNLLKVKIYDFFVGCGDINSAFLPKRTELDSSPSQPMSPAVSSRALSDAGLSDTLPSGESTPMTPLSPAALNGELSVVDRMVSMAGENDNETIEDKMEKQKQAIETQIAESPLLQKQKILDAAEEQVKGSPAADAAVELLSNNRDAPEPTPPEQPKYRHNLLQDDETEQVYLETLGQHLREVHDAYFDEYEMSLPAEEVGRVAELRPGKSKKRSLENVDDIPDAAVIMANMKSRVLRGVHLVLTGVLPLGKSVHVNDTVVWAKTFGATVSETITKKTTHVIASPERRTAKVRQAAKRGGRIAIVNLNWLFACLQAWEKVDEAPYRIHSDAPTNGRGGLPDSFEDKEGATLSSSDEEAALTESETEIEIPNGGKANGHLEIDTDLAELETHKPSVGREDSSPTENEKPEDWEGIDDELAEFLGSDLDSESETESTRSDRSATSTPGGKKRKRNAEAGENGTHSYTDAEEGSRLQKRKRQALERTTSLTNMAAASPEKSPVTSEPVAIDPGGDGGEEDDGGDDLEAALAAEMARQDEEDGSA